jgi:MSHA biogenesis protein MshJ
MTAWWSKQAERIDALSLRERLFVFVAVLVAFFYLLDMLWLAPAQKQLLALENQATAQATELVKLRTEHVDGMGGQGSQGAILENIRALEKRLLTVNTQIEQSMAHDRDATNLPAVLVHFLKRQPGLTLVRTSTVAPEQTNAPSGGGGILSTLSQVISMRAPGDASKAQLDAMVTPAKPELLELTVSGPYLDLVRYVQTLETAMPALRWNAMKMVSDKQPPVLTLQVSMLRSKP